MSVQNAIDERTERLKSILGAANTALQEKNGAAAGALSGLPAAIRALNAGEPKLQYKLVTPSAYSKNVVPDAGYDGLSMVGVAGDLDLVPENIVEGVNIFGVVGTYSGSSGLSIPAEYQAYFDTAKSYYTGTYEHFFIAENDEFVTVGFLDSNFTVLDYDAAAGDFASIGWHSYMYTKAEGTWLIADYTSEESPGYNYARNIRYADFYIEHNGAVLWPVGMDCYPHTTAINYSGWDNGSFSETLETGDVLSYAVTFDSDGRPEKITASGGAVTQISWEA